MGLNNKKIFVINLKDSVYYYQMLGSTTIVTY